MNARELARQAAAISVKEAGLFSKLVPKFLRRAGRAGQAAKAVESASPKVLETLANRGWSASPKSWFSRAGQALKDRPLQVGLPTAAAVYAAGEGLYSAGQGNESLGKQWDQSVTRGLYEGGRLGQARAYLGRLLTRPASTMYGSFVGFQRPGVGAKAVPGAGASWRVGPDGKIIRDVQQQAVKPYWMRVLEKGYQQDQQRWADQLRLQQQELEKQLQEIAQEQARIEAARRAREKRLRQTYGEYGLPAEAVPPKEISPAERKLRAYQKLWHGGPEAFVPKPEEKPEAAAPRGESEHRPARRPSGLHGLQLAGTRPPATTSKDDEEEKLRRALRRYYGYE